MTFALKTLPLRRWWCSNPSWHYSLEEKESGEGSKRDSWMSFGLENYGSLFYKINSFTGYEITLMTLGLIHETRAE